MSLEEHWTCCSGSPQRDRKILGQASGVVDFPVLDLTMGG